METTDIQNDINRVGEPIRFSGYVEDFAKSISAVQFSLDEGANWTTYPVDDLTGDAGISWSFAYTPEISGWYCLRIRAVDGSGSAAEIISSIPFYVNEAEAAIPVFDPRRPHSDEAAPAVEARPIQLRPLGIKNPKEAKIFRSGELFGATEADAEYIRELGIRAIYDIRTHEEVAAAPDPLFAGVYTVALTPAETHRKKDADKRLVAGVIGEYGAPEERMRANYRRYVREYPLIGRALRSIADQKVPCLIHCVNGKDRTGVICAVLQRIAGVVESDIYADYLAYNSLNRDRIAAEAQLLGAGMDLHEREILMSFLETRESYLRAYFDEINLRFGSFDAYVEGGLRLSDTQRRSLCDLV